MQPQFKEFKKKYMSLFNYKRENILGLGTWQLLFIKQTIKLEIAEISSSLKAAQTASLTAIKNYNRRHAILDEVNDALERKIEKKKLRVETKSFLFDTSQKH
jgi:hypothetical protein